jgi:hypothetical protein
LVGHGGEHRAVFVYQIDSYRHWQGQLGRNDFTRGRSHRSPNGSGPYVPRSRDDLCHRGMPCVADDQKICALVII